VSDWTRYDVSPVPKPRQTRADVWKRRTAVLRYRAFADELRSKVRFRTELDLWARGGAFHVVFVIPTPTSWPLNKRLAYVGTPHQQRPDKDNLEKAFTDALWPDEDSHVWDVRATKVWGTRGAIWVRQLDAPELPRIA
jgi:Holliday junction resolvase RusA-like endonuclease